MGTIPGFVFPFYIIGSDPRLIHLSTRISGGKQWIRVEKSETGIISLEFFERFFKAPRKPDPDRIQTSPGDLWKSGCLSRRILWNFNWISNPPESFSEKDGRNFSTESTAPKKATTISSFFIIMILASGRPIRDQGKIASARVENAPGIPDFPLAGCSIQRSQL